MNIQGASNNYPQFSNSGLNPFKADEGDSAKTKIVKEVAHKIFNQAGNPDTLSPNEFAKILGGLSANLQNPINTLSSTVSNTNTNTSPTSINTKIIAEFAEGFDTDNNRLDKTEVEKLLTSIPKPINGQSPKGIQNLNNLVEANGGSFTLDQLKADMKSKLNVDSAKIDEMAQKLFSKLDADRDGKVTMTEITSMQDRIKAKLANAQQDNFSSEANAGNTNDSVKGVDLNSLNSGLADPSSLASLTGGLFGNDTSSLNSSSLGLGIDLIDTNTPTDSTLLG